MSVHQTPDGRWFVRFVKGTIQGKQNAPREYFGRGIDAENKARARNTELGLGIQPARTGKKFTELANYYLESKAEKIELSSILTAGVHLASHLVPFFGRHDAASIDNEMVDSYVSKRRSGSWRDAGGNGKLHHGVSRSTVRRELATMQAVMNFAVKRKQILYNPIQHYDMPREDDAVINPVTNAELQAILKHSPNSK